MTLMHSLLASALRFTGRHREASEIEAAAEPAPWRSPTPPERIPPSPPLASTPAMIICGDERDRAYGSPGGSSAGASAGSGVSAETGQRGSSSANTASASQATASGSGGHTGGAGTEAEREDGLNERSRDSQPHAVPVEHGTHDTSEPELPNLHDAPFAGLHSARLRDRLEREALAGASSTAQDAAITRAADRLLPPELRSLLNHDLPPHLLDVTPAARSARIDALGGEVPAWVKDDPAHDPTILRAREARPAPAHEPAHSPAPSLAPRSPAQPAAPAHHSERER